MVACLDYRTQSMDGLPPISPKQTSQGKAIYCKQRMQTHTSPLNAWLPPPPTHAGVREEQHGISSMVVLIARISKIHYCKDTAHFRIKIQTRNEQVEGRGRKDLIIESHRIPLEQEIFRTKQQNQAHTEMSILTPTLVWISFIGELTACGMQRL